MDQHFALYAEMGSTLRELENFNNLALKTLKGEQPKLEEFNDNGAFSLYIDYKKYFAYKEQFLASNMYSPETNEHIKNIEEYFDKYIDQNLSVRFTNMMTKYDFFDKDVWKSEPQRAIDNIELYLNGNDYVKSL